jgi:hypothetical protein
MANQLWVVASNPVEGREAEFNDWYDNVHVPEVCSLDGVVSATRYEIEDGNPSAPHRYMAIYELDRDGDAVVADLMAARAAGGFVTSASLDMATASSTLWRPCGQ